MGRDRPHDTFDLGMMRALFPLALLAVPVGASAGEIPPDPLGSPMWDHYAEQLFEGAPVVFDKAVAVELPMIAENQHVLPVTVDARALEAVKRIVLFADLNPIPVAVDYSPLAAEPYVATRIKLDQRTPVRAAVLTGDGTWHLAGDWVDAAGGGCSAPPVSRVSGDWAEHLGEMRGAAWSEGADTRLRFAFRHPMDTGLVENIPAYNIDTLTVRDAGGTVLGEMKVWGSVSEDPAFTLLVDPKVEGGITIAARDSNGREFDGTVAPASGARMALAAK